MNLAYMHYITYLRAEPEPAASRPRALWIKEQWRNSGGEEIVLLSDTSALLRPKCNAGVSVGQVGEAGLGRRLTSLWLSVKMCHCCDCLHL